MLNVLEREFDELFSLLIRAKKFRNFNELFIFKFFCKFFKFLKAVKF